MCENDSRLMSLEAYNQIMKDSPQQQTDVSSDGSKRRDSSSFNTPQVLFYNQSCNKRQYDQQVNLPRITALECEIEEQRKENALLRNELSNLRMETQILKSTMQKIKNKKNGYQDLHKTVETLQNHLDTVSKQLTNKDAIINSIKNKEQKLHEQLRISQFRINEVEEQLSKYQSQIVQLHEKILNFNNKDSILLKQKQYELHEKERIITDYVDENRQLMTELMCMKRDKQIMKDQIQRQHILILRHQKRSASQNKKQNSDKYNIPKGKQAKFNKQKIYKLFVTLKKQLIETMKYVNQYLNQLKSNTITKVFEFAEHHLSYVRSLENSFLESKKLSNQQIDMYKSQIAQLKMRVVSSRIMGEQNGHQLSLDTKDLQISTSRTSALLSKLVYPNQHQQYKSFQKHSFNGNQTYLGVRESRQQSEMKSERTERKSIQECYLMKSRKRR